MKPFRRLLLMFVVLDALLAANPARATITVLDYWHMGENDPGAVSGGRCTNTFDPVGGKTLTNTTAGGLYPIYTNGVSVAAAAETGSTLALALTNGQYGTAALATNLTDNFGIECWVNPGTTVSGGQVLAYNGLRGNGWGLYQSATSFEVLYGGEIFFGSAVATAGTWTHLALVRSGGIAILYTNGVPASTNSTTPITPSGSFTVGGDAEFGEYFTGAIDEVRVFTFAAGAFSTNDLLLNSTNVFVSNTNDNGAGSLRAAVANAPTGAEITFATNLSGQTITLTNGQIELSKNVTIAGSALANAIQINGNGQSRIFYVDNVTAALNNLIITNGSDGGFQGAGVLNYGSLTVNNCTFAGNQANSSDGGGGICNETGTLTVNNCTFTGNQASPSFFGGGGICVGGDGDGGAVNVNNCTFNGNQAEYGGAISIVGGTLNINNCTLSGNLAYGTGGGVDIDGGLLNLTNSIVCANIPNNIDAPINSGANNLVDANALLAPLGNYGGPTQTMPPLAGSPAIDAGNNSVTSFLTTDQRGHPRLSGAHVDIGAVEVNPNTIVTTATDSVAGSLRNVMASTTNGDLISFAQNLSGRTILLTNGQIELSNNVAIDASGLASGIVVNGNGQSRVFLVASGVTAVLNSLNIVNGNDKGGSGAGINNQGMLTINNSTLSGNIATGYGGGIENGNVLTVNQTTITGCSSAGGESGGGVDAGSGTATVINQSTITGNTQTNGGGGGVLSYGGAITVNNSIIAGNTGGDIGGYYSSLTLLGINLTNAAPMLATLGNYGGPTQTMPPLPGSPVIDACTNGTSFTTDQRGFPRIAGPFADVGAVEFQYGLIVSNTADSGENSLRIAVVYDPPGSTITFASTLSGQAITLTSGQIILSNNVTIDASALASGVSIQNHSDRMFQVNSGATVNLNSLTLMNGNCSSAGGAVLNEGGNLTLNSCTLSGNLSQGDGGGGAIFNDAGSTLALNNCTLTANHAFQQGGAIFNFNPATLTAVNCTISGNDSDDTSSPRGIPGGGGIFNSGTLHLTNDIVAGNTDPDAANISGSYTGASNSINSAPMLAPLGNYGGPTQTMPPLAGSPVIDAGSDSVTNFLATDQRGYPRLAGSRVDIGAVEAQVAPADNPPVLESIARSGNGIGSTFQFTFTNATAADFTVVTSTNVGLALSKWTVLGEVMQAAPGQYQFIQSGATNRYQFYRVVSP